MAIILPRGVLFRGGVEARIRKKLLDDGHIDTVIGMPANLFYLRSENSDPAKLAHLAIMERCGPWAVVLDR